MYGRLRCQVFTVTLREGGARGAAASGPTVLGPAIDGSLKFLCAVIGL